MEYGKTRKDVFAAIILILAVYWFFETPLYASMLGPLGEYSGKDYNQYKRYCNFESGEALYGIIEGLFVSDELEIENVYILDYTPRWSSLKFHYQRTNQILLEYQLEENLYQIIMERLLLCGFVQKQTLPGQDYFGDFVFFYRENGVNLQTLVAINPIDRRFIVTCFHYTPVNWKSESELSFKGIKSRLFEPPTFEHNISDLGNKTKYGWIADIWKTKTPHS